jgi:RNA polymerase sigma-70 factor, ECF subfamily
MLMDIEAKLHDVALGARGAFADLYRELQPNFIRYATGLLAGDRHAAEDVVDDAFIAIWEQASRYAGHGSAAGWMRRIVRNKAVDWLRKQREPSLMGSDQMEAHSRVPDSAPTPFEVAETNADARRLRLALYGLSIDHREVIWLCYFEDKSVAEIAEIAGCPQNTVKTRLFHARQAMRKLVPA